MADPVEGQDANVVGAGLSSASFRGTLELLSKGWVFLLAAIYASGYIIVSIYHASLGLNEINPLRPKVAAAGLLFLALGLGASYVERYVNSLFKDSSYYESESQRRILCMVSGGLGIYCLDIFGAHAVTLLMRYDLTADWPFAPLWMFGVMLYFVGTNPKKRPVLLRWTTHWVSHWSFLLLCVLTTLALLAMSMPRHGGGSGFNNLRFI